jgi:hypothetical protein
MRRLCARPGCSTPAAATFTFDGLRRIVWLAPLAEASAYSAGDLCRRHADLLKPPRNWELRDLRPSLTESAPAGCPAPSRYATPTAATAPTLPFDRPTPVVPRRVAASAHPLLTTPPERDPVPTATSPLLARAFRNAG